MRSPVRRRRPSRIVVVAGGVALLLVVGGVATYLIRAGDNGPTGSTLYGASFQTDPGEGYQAALTRTDNALGRLDLVRVFYPRAPAPWPGKAPGRNVVVSFKLPPRQVIAGRFDASMRTWFAAAPRNLHVYWCYWHEPENDIEQGAFTAEEFTSAFEHLDQLAAAAGNPRLRSTVILQSYSTRPASGRNWRDYVPDSGSVDVLAWDAYNRDTRRYSNPAAMLDASRRASESLDLPFAVGELGSPLVNGDDGSGRAAWLRSVGDYATQHDAVFVNYFDFVWNDGADDYRLRDGPSVQAWRELNGG